IMHQAGAKVLAVSNVEGAVFNPDGLDIPKLMDYMRTNKTLRDAPNTTWMSNEELLALDVDVLAPCAIENQIRKDNAGDVKAKIIAEGANGPTTPEADDILKEKGVLLIPDILANAGGVTVSYLEWVMDIQSFYWKKEQVNHHLEDVMVTAFNDVWAIAKEKNISIRMAAFVLAVGRVVEALEIRGVFP
ncbi:MAG: Glu/Leu/Phe/Val family dehydrogenase, partial [Candidatus Ranarchaeia archaeon]